MTGHGAVLRTCESSGEQVDVPYCLDRLICARAVSIIPLLLTARRTATRSMHPTETTTERRIGERFYRVAATLTRSSAARVMEGLAHAYRLRVVAEGGSNPTAARSNSTDLSVPSSRVLRFP